MNETRNVTCHCGKTASIHCTEGLCPQCRIMWAVDMGEFEDAYLVAELNGLDDSVVNAYASRAALHSAMVLASAKMVR